MQQQCELFSFVYGEEAIPYRVLWSPDQAAEKVKIKVYPNTTLYSIRKENINGLNAISYSIYTFAKEKLSERDGTFIGSSILYTNAIAKENITIEKLNKFHYELIKKNVVEERLIVSHSKEFSISKSVTNDFDKLAYNLKKIEEPTNFNLSNSSLVVYSRIDTNTLQQNFKKSLELLNSFDTIFFTDNKEIAEFVKNRNIYKVIDENGFERELQILRDEKKKRLQSTINDFEKELFELEENKRITIKNFKESIEQNSRLHQENSKKIDESNKQINITRRTNRSHTLSRIDLGTLTHRVLLLGRMRR